jgi:hypothetical protein
MCAGCLSWGQSLCCFDVEQKALCVGMCIGLLGTTHHKISPRLVMGRLVDGWRALMFCSQYEELSSDCRGVEGW